MEVLLWIIFGICFGATFPVIVIMAFVGAYFALRLAIFAAVPVSVFLVYALNADNPSVWWIVAWFAVLSCAVAYAVNKKLQEMLMRN